MSRNKDDKRADAPNKGESKLDKNNKPRISRDKELSSILQLSSQHDPKGAWFFLIAALVNSLGKLLDPIVHGDIKSTIKASQQKLKEAEQILNREPVNDNTSKTSNALNKLDDALSNQVERSESEQSEILMPDPRSSYTPLRSSRQTTAVIVDTQTPEPEVTNTTSSTLRPRIQA